MTSVHRKKFILPRTDNVEDFLAEYSVSGTPPTPANSDLFEVDTIAQPLDDMGRDNFHSRVAKILFVAKQTRPDVLTAVSFLSHVCNVPLPKTLISFRDY